MSSSGSNPLSSLARQQIDREADIVVGDSENAMPVPDRQRNTHDFIANDAATSGDPTPRIVRDMSAGRMSRVSKVVDLTRVPAVPWAWVDEHVYAASRVQRESVAERTAVEYGLPVPADQRNNDSIQDGRYCGVHGIPAGWRWLGKANLPTRAHARKTKKINNLTVISAQSHE